MKRKVIKQGNNTLTITLPKDWTEKFNVKAGDEIDLNETENGIILNTEYHKKQKSIDINIDHLERLALAKLLVACFEQGYDKITLHFSKQKIVSWSHGNEDITDTINFFVGRLIGFEVISQTSKSITIGNLSEKLTKFEDILSRLFFLIEEYIKHLIDAIKTGEYNDLKQGENRHDNITKFVALASRIVFEENLYNKNQAVNYFTILNYLDKVTDFIRYAYKNTLTHKRRLSKETLVLAQKSFDYFELYRHFFYKPDYSLINQLDDKRGEIKNLFLKSENYEKSITAQFESMVEIMNGIIKSRIALSLSQNETKNFTVSN